jgi:ferredoxin
MIDRAPLSPAENEHPTSRADPFEQWRAGRGDVRSGSPPAATRLDGFLTRVDGAFAWFDGWGARWLPPELNPLTHSGAAANAALVLAVVSGVALLLWYSPSLQFAYSSLEAMRGGIGGWMRAVHRYSSDLAMLFVLWHALRVFVARKFAGARWVPWITGVILIVLVWFIGWTGYWLIWDQPAQQVAVTSIRWLDALPIFGEPLGRLFVADRMVPSLLFFVVFFTHMLLPLGIAIGLALHLARVSRAKLFPPNLVWLALCLGLTVAAALVPAPLDARAAMAVKPPAFIVDAWYLTPLALALRLQSVGLWIAGGSMLIFAAALPWLLGRRRAPAAFQAVVEASRCHACTQCVQDCPFEAVTMVTRTDGRKFASQASVDPAKCVGCGVCAGSCDSEGIALPWFDTRREEARIEAEIATARAAVGTRFVAFVGGDIDGGPALFARARWDDRLRGYSVHYVPTASWVRPKLVERLLKSGVAGVLVVRDARAESAARDGNRWVADRLDGTRAPRFRPDRAGGSTAWRVVDFNPSRANDLVNTAADFRAGRSEGRSAPRRFRHVLAGVTLALVLGAAVVVPSRLRVTNPASPAPEFVFSFKALGDRAPTRAAGSTAAPDFTKPVHMRGVTVEKPHRADVIVRLTLDGAMHARAYVAKGISRDGPALDEWRLPLSPGPHALTIEILTGPDATALRWEGKFTAEPRRLHVVSYETGGGFRVE